MGTGDEDDLIGATLRLRMAMESLIFGGDSREWRYQNKGTYEDNEQADFDRTTVSTIVEELDKLDAALT